MAETVDLLERIASRIQLAVTSLRWHKHYPETTLTPPSSDDRRLRGEAFMSSTKLHPHIGALPNPARSSHLNLLRGGRPPLDCMGGERQSQRRPDGDRVLTRGEATHEPHEKIPLHPGVSHRSPSHPSSEAQGKETRHQLYHMNTENNFQVLFTSCSRQKPSLSTLTTAASPRKLAAKEPGRH
uniref:Uncharacterized protein n=1 Tax=Ditylenchus dipsaci TaxID=166011 RepID=A0A915D6Y8_9BILA